MLDKEEPVGPHGVMDVIATLAAKGASGRLDIVAGATEGALLFQHGKLVDARLGHLSGFQAINAVASMRDSRFHFDPSVAVPAMSSISPSERLVLKQFFGIETADSHDYATPVMVQDVDQTTVVPGTVIGEASHEIDNDVPSEPIETPAAIYQARPRWRVRYVAVFALAVLVVAVTVAAVILREKFRERTAAAAVASRTESVTPPPAAAAQPSVSEEPRVIEQPRVTRVTEESRVTEEPPASTPDLTGEWTVINTVDTTAYRSYQNLRIGFAVSINQKGSTFTAKGRKVSENGQTLPATSRTPIELQGSINGDRIEATFSENGALRKTNGRFVWRIDRAGGGLTGTFASSAARTSGKSTATREM